MKQPSHIIFDLDGTLVDSAPGILTAFASVLAARGIHPRCELGSHLIGPPLQETLAQLSGIAEAAELAPLIDDFKRRYDVEGVAATPSFDGIDAALEALAKNGFVLHLATNKRIIPTLAIVEHLGWKHYFASIYALDIYEPRLPSKAALLAHLLAEQELPPEACVYVGDKHEDGDAAERNRLAFIAVAWGYGDFNNTEISPCWAVSSTPSSLVKLLISQGRDFSHRMR